MIFHDLRGGGCPRPKGLGYRYEGRLRGLIQPMELGFVKAAEGFSPTAGDDRVTGVIFRKLAFPIIGILLAAALGGVLLLRAAPSRALDRPASLYVGPNGSDSNSGSTPDQPFQTIQHAIDLAQPGDTINLAAGVYLQDAISKRDGTASAPITIKGPSDAVLKGGGGARIFQINHDNLTLDGFTIDGLWGSADTSAGFRGKLLYVVGRAPNDGVSGLKVLRMTFKNAGGECLRMRYFAQHNEIG